MVMFDLPRGPRVAYLTLIDQQFSDMLGINRRLTKFIKTGSSID